MNILTLSTYSDKIAISKEVFIMKKAFNTSIDEEILEQFRAKCKEEKLPINVVLERFMQGYVNEDFKLEMKYFGNNGK